MFHGDIFGILDHPIKVIVDCIRESNERKHELKKIKLEHSNQIQKMQIDSNNEHKQRAHESAAREREVKLKHQMAKEQKEIEIDLLEVNAKIEHDKREHEASIKERNDKFSLEVAREQNLIEIELRNSHAEIDMVITQFEDERRDKLVEALKNYQLTLASAAQEITRNLGKMSIELRKQAQDLVLEKTNEYLSIRSEAQRQSLIEIKEVRESFADDKELCDKMIDMIINERHDIVSTANDFIKALSDDIKRLTESIDRITEFGIEASQSYLEPIAKQLGVNISNNTEAIGSQKTNLLKG